MATQPNLPVAINFLPPSFNPAAPAAPNVNPPTITAPRTGNGDDMYIKDGGNNSALAGSLAYAYVGMISQYSTSGNGTMNVKVNSGATMDISTSGVTFTGHQGPTHNGGSTYTNNLTTTGYTGYAAMKLVGGHRIDINDTTINMTGSGTAAYDRWLFHTDGHNYYGASTWVLNNGTKVNMGGDHLVLYTSQYHQSPTGNTGFVNNGTITTSGSNNIGWISLDESHGAPSRSVIQYFHNNAGTINLGGTGDILAYIMEPVNAANSGFSYINDGTINMTGDSQYGIVVNGKVTGGQTTGSTSDDYNSSEIMLSNPLVISGTGSTGIVFKKWMNLAGGTAFSTSGAGNEVTTLPGTTRASKIKTDLSGSKNTGVYFESTSPKTFTLNEYKINIKGNNNTGIFVKQGTVALGSGTDHSINITSGNSISGNFEYLLSITSLIIEKSSGVSLHLILNFLYSFFAALPSIETLIEATASLP